MTTISPFDYAALEGRPVTEGHVARCREHGHASHTVDGVDSGTCPRCGEVTTPVTHPADELRRVHVEVQKRPGREWRILVDGSISDAAAGALTFHADPRDVLLGAFASIVDEEGERIGHVSRATFHRGSYRGPEYAVVELDLL